MRALGIDPGTRSYDFCCIEDDVDNVVVDVSVSSEIVASEPSKIFEMIKSSKADVIVGPSGYGLEFKHISAFTIPDFQLTTLDKEGDVNIPVLSGLRRLLRMMKDAKMNAYSLPGVVLLPTIPMKRKVNKIDMGTADKTCVAAFAIWDQAQEYSIDYNKTSLINVEMGFGYNAAMIVERGKIIDGIGGTIFPGPGYLTLSQMDGELAYLLGDFSKLKLFQGGASYIAANCVTDPEEFAQQIDVNERYNLAWEAMVEGIVKAVAIGQTVMEGKPQEVIITGRLSRIPRLYREVEEVLTSKFEMTIRRPSTFTREAKDVAQGAALIANGLGGGRYQTLVDVLEIKGATGTVLDHVYLQGFDPEAIIDSLRGA